MLIIRIHDVDDIDEPAEVNSAVLQAVKMVCVHTESFAKLTRERTKSGITLVLIMVHITAEHQIPNEMPNVDCFYLHRNATSITTRSGTVSQHQL
jgi:hypothetical protein